MREYLPGERPFESLPSYSERYTHLWVGLVLRYDQDNETCDVQWVTYNGGRPAASITIPLAGPRTYMGGPPEEGSYVYCQWVPNIATGNYNPVIVGYAPTGFVSGRRFALIPTAKDEAADPPRRGTRFKMPKLYAGDLAMVSSAGSQVIADENLLLGSAGLTETFHRSSDMAILTTGLQHYTEGADSRVRWGMVERDAGWVSGASPGSDPLCEDGLSHHYITKGKDASRLEDGGSAWVEHRVELRESSRGSIPIADGRYFIDSIRVDDWSYRSVLGTLVGNQASHGALYGKPLVRIVLSGTGINRVYQEASDEDQEDTATSWAHLSMGVEEHSAIASADWDKSGRLALSLGATSGSHPAGGGKSLQVAADGSFEAVFGADSSGVAITLVSEGDWNQTVTGGWNQVVEGGWFQVVEGEWYQEVQDNWSLEVDGDYGVHCTGEMNLQADGIATLSGSVVYLGGGAAAGSGRPF